MQGRREGVAGGAMARGPWTLGGPWVSGRPLQRAHELERGPIQMTLRNQCVKPEDLFFFGDHIIFRTKLQHFLRLFWTSQNRKFVIFELAPGPLLVPGGTGCMQLQSCYENYFLDIKSVACLIITKRSVSELGSSRRAA